MLGLKRSHMCAEVTECLEGQSVTVTGWVNKRRDLGPLIFVALRDRTGIVQITVDENSVSEELYKKAVSVRGEFVLAVKGIVTLRTAENVNPNMETGKIEIIADEIRILSEAETPPFGVADKGVKDDMRLKYRYIDLRRPELQRNFAMRHQALQITRKFFSDGGFYEIETPNLIATSPEGARDYIVPSRVHKGSFYALPQSPQIFKQLLMVSGFDKYFQVARCFRDEDLRANRQPEFTQIDVEMSFVDVEDIISINEKFIKMLFKEMLNVDVKMPIDRMTYAEAMERFGSDKPDLRFGMEIKNVSEIVKGSSFAMFEDSITNGGSVRGIKAEGCANFTRKQLDALGDYLKVSTKVKGLAYIALLETGEFKTTLSKFFDNDKLAEIVAAFGAKQGDLVLLCADSNNNTLLEGLGALRVEVAGNTGIRETGEYKFLWVTEFPLLEWAEEEQRYTAKHHPFTAPMDEDLEFLDSDRGRVRAKAYDIVLNGEEIGGGSVRIYRREIQDKMFELLGFSEETARERFGYLLDAFAYGAPPHGGIAYGFDRLMMFICGAESIRDVIAFPKVKDASCPLTNAPSNVLDGTLDELGLSVIINQ